MPDKYDEAVEYLTNHPDEIQKAWNRPTKHPAGCLFLYLTPNGLCNYQRGCLAQTGCLTQIKNDWQNYSANLPKELVDRILADDRIPRKAYEIKTKYLPAFAEYQREADATIRNK